jgi:adenylate kinase
MPSKRSLPSGEFATRFPHIMVLFVDEAESVARQLKRGRQVVAHNEEVTRSGGGELWEERATDSSETLARNRYRVFKEQT